MLTDKHLKEIAEKNRINPSILRAFIRVETPGNGFDTKTGKILIQFEPIWFKRLVPFAPSGLWSVNKVDVQSKEWIAFNDAFKIDSNGAMQSTSIGLGQIMGFHYKLLGFNTVGEMWDFAKVSEENQVIQLITFLKKYKNGAILEAFKLRDYDKVAQLYNGKNYKAIAKKYGRLRYDLALGNEYDRAVSIFAFME